MSLNILVDSKNDDEIIASSQSMPMEDSDQIKCDTFNDLVAKKFSQDHDHQFQQQSSRVSQSFRLSHRCSFPYGESSQIANTSDRLDSIPLHMKFTYLDALGLIFSIISFLFDIITDVMVAMFHYFNANYWYFALTVTFIVVPTLIMTSISLRWYILDSKESGSPKVSKTQWLFRVIFLLLQLGPIMRYIDSLLYGLQFRKLNERQSKRTARKYFQYMIYEDTDATMLRLFECFMESAPQLVLQIYIMAVNTPHNHNDWIVAVQSVSVVASLISLSWSLVSYLRILRMSLINKQNMSWPGAITQFLWRFSTIASRVLVLALFASIYTYYISIVCTIHWLVMFFWILSMKTTFCDNRFEEIFYNAVLAIIFIFCYFNPIDSPTRWRYLFYYTFMLTENIFLLGLWWPKCDSTKKWYCFPAFISYFLVFFIGLVFMVVYYLKLHPTRNIRLFRSHQEMTTTNPIAAKNFNNENLLKSLMDSVECEKKFSVASSSKIESCSTSNSMNSYDYKRQLSNVWTTQSGSMLLHPRPAMPHQ